MEEDKYYKNIQKALEDLPENYSILEEQIDVEIQMKYFEFTKSMREKNISEECFTDREELFDSEVGEERKKEILTAIAVYDDVKAYRTIEKYVDEAEGELKQWAILALQESRMLMHSSLLDEQQVFISTGLGGKGKKLRYYVVFLSANRDEMLDATQQKLLKTELIFELDKHEGEFETMDFMEGFSSTLVMLPLHVEIKQVFQNVIEECNQYGGFLLEDLIITNVKVLSRSEIIQLIHQKKNADTNDLEE
ncbi:hypothetical protein [uncultured Draconibacterium sp.]|uniref:hypothetical protein n=1 Tax=uncultured Draconibacterium sp. TaxID=1573823 RepID=UPI003217B4E6